MLLWSKYYDGAVPCGGLIYPGTISRVDVCPPARGIVEIFVFACHVHALGHSSSKESLLDDVSPFLEQPTTLSRNNETKTQPVMAVHQWCCRSPRIDRPTGNEHLILCSPAGHGVLSHIHTCSLGFASGSTCTHRIYLSLTSQRQRTRQAHLSHHYTPPQQAKCQAFLSAHSDAGGSCLAHTSFVGTPGFLACSKLPSTIIRHRTG